MIYRPSTAIIELVGPKQPPKKTHLWGLTLVTSDVDRTHAQLPQSTKAPWDAVQPGRRMTVLKHSHHGISTALAFMSPHIKGVEGKGMERERLLEQRALAQEAELRKRDSLVAGHDKIHTAKL